MGRARSFLNIVVILSLVLTLPMAANSGVIEDVTNYFEPASGSLIAVNDDDYVINLDAGSGVMVGDLLSIVTPGEKLVDPASGAILGSLDTVKGIIKITRLRSGFSHARPLGVVSNPQKGDLIRRYQNLTAIFQDQKGTGGDLYNQLVSGLPALEWQGSYSEQSNHEPPSVNTDGQTQLTFILTDSTLKVQDSSGQVVRSFPVTDQFLAHSEAPGRASVLSVNTPSSPASSQSSQTVVAWEKQNQRNYGQVEYSVDYPGYKTLGEFPGVVLMADFSTNKGQALVVGSNGSELNVFAVTDRMSLIATEKDETNDKIHAVAWWQPEVDGPLFLAVTASTTKSASYGTTTETVFSSSVYRFKDGQLASVVHNLPYLLGTFDRDSDGKKETLLGQRFDLDTVYGPIRELKLDKDGLNDVEIDFELPLHFPVQGSLLADLTGDGKTETIYTRKGILYIISDGKLRYESARQMGGSLSRLTYDVNPGQSDALFTSIAFEVPQIAADLDGDGQLELVAISTGASALSAPGLDLGSAESWLSVIKYQNGRFVKGLLGEKLEKPIQGLTIEKGKAMIVLSRLDSILNGQGQSHLLALPLAP